MLSPSQAAAEKVFSNFLQDPNISEMVISGAAGTGKSYLVKYLRAVNQNLLKMTLTIDKRGGWRTYYTATTNKAAKVLQNFLGEPVGTIHSLLGLKVWDDHKTGAVRLQATDKTRMLGKALVFIDEASMVSRELLGYIRDCSTKGETKIVFIGDQYQLAPVGEGNSVVFRNPKLVVHLTEIQRQVAGSPIIQAAHVYKELLDTGLGEYWPQILEAKPGINVVTGDEFEAEVNQVFGQPHDPDDLRILAWTNQRVVAYNRHVRGLYTQNLDFEEGERVVTNNPIMLGNHIIHPIDSVVEITRIIPTVYHEIDGFMVCLVGSGRQNWFMPKNQADTKFRLREHKKAQNWEAYFDVKNNWLDLRSFHAQTVHKAQGSTYKKVFIDVSDIGENKKWEEICRLMYVAISRASEEVYLFGSLPWRAWRNR